jgi:hypothetical protein
MARSIMKQKPVIRVSLTPQAIKLCDTQAKQADRNFSQHVEHLIKKQSKAAPSPNNQNQQS